MNELRERLIWMTDEQEPFIRRLLWQQAAHNYEAAEAWEQAASCWASAGQHAQAAALYERTGEVLLAAEAYLQAEAYGKAFRLYQQLATQPLDKLAQLKGRLGQVACHYLATWDEAVFEGIAYEQGQQLMTAILDELHEGVVHDPLLLARCWQAVGYYGNRMDRFDLLHTGYEMALDQLDETRQRAIVLGILKAYHADASEWRDQLLVESIVERWTQLNRPVVQQPAWWALRDEIEIDPFRDGVRDVLHFTTAGQRAAWDKLAEQEKAPDIDDYLRELAPPEMVYIPPGAFLMGSTADDPDANDDEKPQHSLWLTGYYIDRYPVTNARYAAFMAAGGYQEPRYWTETGWQQKENRNWAKPHYWTDSSRNQPQQPVVAMSWYEAFAYSRWAGKALTSETHWEKAASWNPETNAKHIYPWGNQWVASMHIYQPNSWPIVGEIVPSKHNYYGVADMGGLYSWCSAKWIVKAYPYDAADGREDIEGTHIRSLRGGGSNQQQMRCGFRFWDDPGNWFVNNGFRCQWPHAFS
ncbi:MAG: formylglycine-generating enzyme family protein [Candidatus Promineifilaceae bacterium]